VTAGGSTPSGFTQNSVPSAFTLFTVPTKDLPCYRLRGRASQKRDVESPRLNDQIGHNAVKKCKAL